MSKVRAGISMSLDGFVAGPQPTEAEPLGAGGEQLHEWVVALRAWREPHGQTGGEVNESTPVMEETIANVGATIMGRNMFGGGPGPWRAPAWNGWWGDEPPFHHPVFVLTHHARAPLVLKGTTFHFVTDGADNALAQAREMAGERDVAIGGGAKTIQQYLAAGLIDELVVSVVPVLLGGGARLFADLGQPLPRLRQVEAIPAPGVTHIRYARIG